MKKFFPYQHSLRDGDDLEGMDRGDEVVVKGEAPPTDEEKRLAEELKQKQEAEAAKAKEKEKEKENDDDDDKKRKDTRIPLARHKELLEAERLERTKLEAKLAQYEGAEDIAKTNEELNKAEERLVGLEKEHAKLITDGKHEEAAVKMGEIRKLERSMNEIRTDLKAAAAESRAYERARYDITVDRVEEAYPVMNPANKDHEDPEMRYDVVKVRKVLAVARGYQTDGMTPSKALQEAVKDLLGEPKTAKQKTAVEVTPRVDEAAKKKAEREEEARRKAAEAAGKTPPSPGNAGKDSDALGGTGALSGADVMKMSYADFSKLDESTLSRLRGDVVE